MSLAMVGTTMLNFTSYTKTKLVMPLKGSPALANTDGDDGANAGNDTEGTGEGVDGTV